MKKNSKPGSQGQENDDKSTTRFAEPPSKLFREPVDDAIYRQAGT